MRPGEKISEGIKSIKRSSFLIKKLDILAMLASAEITSREKMAGVKLKNVLNKEYLGEQERKCKLKDTVCKTILYLLK